MNVREMIKWDELGGSLPVIVQESGTSEVLVVSRLDQAKFEELLDWWPNRTSTPEPEWCSHAIPQELFIDCDADCLLIKTAVSPRERRKCWQFFQTLAETTPGLLFAGSPLVLAVAQDSSQRDILMAAFMDEEALHQTLLTSFVHYHSRKRRKIWKKGEESGNVQHFFQALWDHRAHAGVVQICQEGGAACHDGYRSCFYRRIEDDGSVKVIGERVFDPQLVYKKGK